MTDPRVDVMAMLLTANEQLVQDTIRHMVVLERFKKGEVAKITRFLETKVFPDIIAKVEGGLGAIASRGLKAIESKHLANTLTSINTIIAKGVKEGMTKYVKDAKMLAAIEANWQVSSLTEAVPLEVSFNMPSPATLAAVVDNAPVNGKLIEDWFESLGASTFDKVKQQVSIGLAQGETVEQMVRRLRGTAAARFKDGVFATTKHQAQAIVRTSANHVSSRAREATYAANEDVIKEIQIVATLDSRTTDICMGYDGRTFPVDSGPRPPFHINCRTTTVPITKSWKEIAGLKDVPSKAERASMNGQVPAKMTYGKWLKGQSKAIQIEALGPGKAALFRAGKISVKDLTNKFGASLTLGQLQQKVAKKAAKVGLPPPPAPPKPPVVVAPPKPPAAPKPPVAVTQTPDPEKIEGILEEFLTATGPAKAKLKQDAIDAGLVWTKAPKNLDDIDKMMGQFQPSTGLSPAIKPSLTDEVRQELTNYVKLGTDPGTATPDLFKARRRTLLRYTEKVLDKGDLARLRDGLYNLGYKGPMPDMDNVIGLDNPWRIFLDTLKSSDELVEASALRLRRLGYIDVLPIDNDELQAILGVETRTPFAPPTALDVKSLQYGDLVDDVSDAFEDYTPKAVAAMEGIQKASSIKEIVKIYEDLTGATDAFKVLAVTHIDTVRDAAYWSIRHLGDAPGSMKKTLVTHRRMLKDPSLGPSGGWTSELVHTEQEAHAIYWRFDRRGGDWYGKSGPDGATYMNSQYWNKKNRGHTIATQRSHYESAVEQGELPFKSTDGMNGQHTIVHELGHHFGEGRTYIHTSEGRRAAATLHPKHKPLYDAVKRYESHVSYDIQSRPMPSGYARQNTKEAWAETWARMVLKDPAEWDDLTKLAFTMIEEEYAKAGLKLPAILRKASAVPKGFVDVSKWKQIGGQKGSNPGGVYQAPDGKKYYVKFYDDVDHVDNEVIANRLYREAGLKTPEVHHGYSDGRYAVVSEWQEGLTAAGEVATDGFATDAWLANWDVVGLEFDNLLKLEGAAYRVDAGGSLLFRAQGAAKGAAFGDEVTELLTLRDSTKAPQAASLYAQMTDAQIVTSISRVEAVTDEAIDTLVDKYWRGKNLSLRDELKLKLKTRRNNLLKERDAMLDKLAAEHKLAQAGEEAAKLGLHDPRSYDVRYSEWTDTLTSGDAPLAMREQYAAIRSFTGGGYGDIRAYQRKGHAAYIDYEMRLYREQKTHILWRTPTGKRIKFGDPQWEKQAMIQAERSAGLAAREAAHLDAALGRAPSFQGTLYRGIRDVSPADVQRNFGNVGSIIEMPESNSFAQWKTKAFRGNVQLEIRNSTKSGVDVDILSAESGEMEIITRRGGKYRVVSIEEFSNDPDSWPQFKTDWSDPKMQKAYGTQMNTVEFDGREGTKNWYIVLEEV